LTLGWLSVCAAVFAGGNNEAAANAGADAAASDGREVVSILEPELAGFPEGDASQLRGYVRGILSNNFAKYSGMTVDNQANTRDYLLEVKIEKHPWHYTVSLTLQRSDADSLAIEAVSGPQNARTVNDLKFGRALNLATQELLLDKGVKLSAADKSALSKPVDDEQASAASVTVSTGNRFGDEQNANIAADYGLKPPSERTLPDVPDVDVPKFTTPTVTMPAFTAPAIQVFRTKSTGGLQADRARWREVQAANKAAVEEQQEYLLRQRDAIRDQWNVILAQWQTFLGEAETRRQLLRNTEQEIFRVRADLEEELREAQEYYRDSPPSRILYDPKPKEYVDFERDTVNEWFQIASVPTSLKMLTDRLDNLTKLNKSFTAVNKAFEDVNAAVAARFAQVEGARARVQDALDKVQDALDEVNAIGRGLPEGYKVVPQSIEPLDWTIPPATTAYGSERKLKTSWDVAYPRQFDITVCLLDVRGEDDIHVLGRIQLTLTNDIAWNGPLKPEPDSGWYSFHNVKIDDISEDGTLTVWVESVNGIDVETAALSGYIEVIPDGSRIPGIGWQTDVRESWRRYWSDNRHFNSLEVAAGTAFATPAFLVSGRLTFSPFRHFFFEAGSDVGLAHGMWNVRDVEYLSIAPYLHLNFFYDMGDVGSEKGFVLSPYGGVGGGMSFSRYTYPSEPDPVTVNMDTGVFDVNGGVRFIYRHSVIDLRATIKTNFQTGVDFRVTVGYGFRFGYFAPRYGGMPARLTGLN
jgi:hypothetical protein